MNVFDLLEQDSRRLRRKLKAAGYKELRAKANAATKLREALKEALHVGLDREYLPDLGHIELSDVTHLSIALNRKARTVWHQCGGR